MSEDEDALWQWCAGLWAKPDPWDKPVVHLGEKLDTMSPDAKPYLPLAPYCKVEPSGNCSVSTDRIADDPEIWRDVLGMDAAPSEDEEFKALMAMHEAGPHAKRKRPAYSAGSFAWETVWTEAELAEMRNTPRGQHVLASMRLPRVERIPPSEWVHPPVAKSDDRTKRVEPSESFYEEYARIDPKSYEELLVADPRLAVMKPLEHVAPVEGHLDYTKLQKLYDRHLNQILAITGLNQPLEPVPDSPSEIAVTEEMLNAAMWTCGCDTEQEAADIYRAMRALEPNEHRKSLAWDKHADTIRRDRDAALEERAAECAHAEAAQKELTEETRLREFWRDRCLATEKEVADLKVWDTFHQAQIVRLMAERDEARNLLAVANDKLTPFLAAEPKPEPELKHNPFRVIEKDRRMMGS